MNRLRRTRGSRFLVRKALAAVTALLTACGTMRVEPMTASLQGEVAGHGASVVLMRFTGERGGKPFNPLADTQSSGGPRVVFRNLDTEATFRSPADLSFPAPSEDAANAGWAYFVLPAGSYYLGLNTSPGDLRAPGQSLGFVVPAKSSVLYIGTFRISCSGDTATNACAAEARIDNEAADAADIATKNFAAVGAFVAELAKAYPIAFAFGAERFTASGPDIALNRATWRLRREQDEPPPPKPTSTSSRSGGGGGDFFRGCGGGPGCGALILTILVVAGTIYAVDQVDKALAGPEQKPCTDALGESVTVDGLKPLLTGFGFDADAQRAADGTSLRWEVTVSRVLLRKCTAGDTYAVEVAARWRAAETGAGRPEFDAVLVSAPESPAGDKRVSHPWDRNSPLPPWEEKVPVASVCRPLADYCAAGGSGLVLQDIADALQGMRASLRGFIARPSGTSASLPLQRAAYRFGRDPASR